MGRGFLSQDLTILSQAHLRAPWQQLLIRRWGFLRSSMLPVCGDPSEGDFSLFEDSLLSAGGKSWLLQGCLPSASGDLACPPTLSLLCTPYTRNPGFPLRALIFQVPGVWKAAFLHSRRGKRWTGAKPRSSAPSSASPPSSWPLDFPVCLRREGTVSAFPTLSTSKMQ